MNVTSNIFSQRTARAFTSSDITDATMAHNSTDIVFSSSDYTWSTTDSGDTNTTFVQTEPESRDVLLMRRISDALDFWVPPFLFLIGTITNTLVIMVMRSKDFRHMSTSFYMAVTATVDTVSLFTPLLPHYLYVNFPHIFDSVRHVHVICSISHLIGWMTSNFGVFLTVAMTIDRTLAVQFPLKAPTLCTVRKAKIVTVCLLVFVLLMDGHVAFTTRMVDKEVKAYLCAIDRDFSEVYRIFHDYVWPTMRNVLLMISFTAIIIGNIIITLHVKRSEDSKGLGEGAKSAGGSQSKKTSSKSRQLSMMLIIDSASMIICTMPLTITMMMDQSFQPAEQTEVNPFEIAKNDLVFSIGFYLLHINHTTSFFLYCAVNESSPGTPVLGQSLQLSPGMAHPPDIRQADTAVIAMWTVVRKTERISKAIDFWVPPLVFFAGTLTNTLVIMVMRSKHFRHMSTSFYMAVSALVDIISLLVPIPPHYLYVNFPHCVVKVNAKVPD
ncbi:uncharacterized protein LOC143287210 [Babylonia areolata]|uniref:uncharacterized protein LOC143287210 n=1 Tax=Babylonia areolata TaxID=304850 RepID=UPI003FD5C4EA